MSALHHHALFAPKRPRGLNDEETTYAAFQRARGRSWASISRMLGRSEQDIRTACDPTLRAERGGWGL